MPLLFAAALLLVASLSQAQTPPRARHTLMPVPASVTFGEGRLAVGRDFSVAIAKTTEPRLVAAIDRALRRLERRTGLEFARGHAKEPSTATLIVECDGPASRVPGLGENEAYALKIDATHAVLKAPTTVGAMRGVETLLQLLAGDRDGYYLPAVTIDDKPRFPWRGLLIDVGRHFLPIEVIRRNIDGMAAVKLNVLHLHLTEDQGFRIESRRFPKLHLMGSDGQYFTQDQIREIVAYAADRGIRVVAEFDMPGHVTSWLVGHPELASAPGPYEISRTWGVHDAAFDPTRPAVYELLDTFLGEMAGLFPDAYMHIGGDENEGKHWGANPAIQAFMKKNGLADAHALQAYFNRRLSGILFKHGKRMVGWDEILHPDLPPDIVIQSWRGQASLADGARKGYSGILSNGYYIDLMQPTAQHYLNDPLPPGSSLTPEDAARVLGGEATMWSEWVGPETVDSRIWPRTAAIAERFWSPASVRDVADMFRRLVPLSIQLEDLGLQHESQMPVMLRRMAGTPAIGQLLTVATLVEPVKGYARGGQKPGGQFTPLTTMVDVARPDSINALRFRTMVDELLADAPRFRDRRTDVALALEEWRNLRPGLDRLIDQAPVLREIAPLVADLTMMGDLGLEAVSYLAVRQAPPALWRESAMARLDAAAKPKAAVESSVTLPMRRLVTAASELPRLLDMSPAEWRARVEALASPPPKR